MKTLLSLIFSFSKIGLISLGGGNSMLKLLEYEAVNFHHWLSQEEYVRMVGSSFLFPGLTGVKLAALIGYKVAGFTGLVFAVACLNLPGLILVFFGYKWLNQYNNPITQKIMTSVQYGALALLAAATYSIAESITGLYYSFTMVATCVIFFLALTFFSTFTVLGIHGLYWYLFFYHMSS